MSFQSRDQGVLQAQLQTQELCVLASSGLCSVSGSDLLVSMGEKLSAALMCIKDAAGTLTGIVPVIVNDTSGNPTQIKLTGEGTASASTCYIIKYQTQL